MASSGNFCTLNPLDCDDSGDLTNGNLTLSHTDGDWRTAFGSMGVSSGKWYFESRQINSESGNGYATGVQRMSEGLNSKVWTNYLGNSYSTYGYSYAFYTKGSGDTSERVHNNSFVTLSDITAGVAGDIYQIALDLDNSKIWFGKNNTWTGSGDPAGNSNETYSSVPAGTWCSAVCSYSSSGSEIFTHNYGQDSTFNGVRTAGGNADGNGFGDFVYTPPTGFLAICSANLSVSDDIDPAQTDDDYPSKQFGVVLYTGNGGSNAVTGLGFQPDLVWGKCRSHSQAPILIDSVRGQSLLFSSLTNVEQTSNGPFMTSYDSDGFTLASSGSNPNDSGRTYVAWCWRAGGSASSDASGDITVNRSTNDKSKFTIATWTGNGSSGNTIAHGLGVKPAMTIIKRLNATSAFNTWHQGYNDGDYDSFAELQSNASWYANQGANGPFTAAPGTDYLTLTAYAQVNASGGTYVGYFWADVEGMQKFGSFEGNSDADGPFVYTGFRPRMVFVKAADATENWQVRDTARSTFNADSQVRIYWNSADAEGSASTASPIDFLSNGFKVRGSNTEINGATMVYGAWADVPFKYNNTF